MNKKEEFDSAGEAIGYVSEDQAMISARRLAAADEGRYKNRLGWNEITWTELSSETRKDSYRIILQFRRPARGLQEEQTGEEEFVFNLLGELQFRQVLAWPTEAVQAGVPAAEKRTE